MIVTIIEQMTLILTLPFYRKDEIKKIEIKSTSHFFSSTFHLKFKVFVILIGNLLLSKTDFNKYFIYLVILKSLLSI